MQFFPVGSLRDLPDDVSGPTVIEGLVGSSGNVHQPRVLVLQLLQSFLDPPEGVIQKIPGGGVHVPPRGLPAGSSFWMVGRRGRRRVRRRRRKNRSGKRLRASGRRRWRIRNYGVAGGLRLSGFRLQLVCYLVGCNRQLVLFIQQEQVVLLVEVEDEGGEKRRLLPDVGKSLCHHFMDEEPPIYQPGSEHCSKQGVGHGKANPFGLVRIQDVAAL